MTTYKVLLDDLGKLRQNVASFRRVVLHSHSPGSYDFQSSTLNGETMSLPSDVKTSKESLFIELLNKTNLDMVALTDHMKCECSCRISASPICNNICVLPGMEVSLRPVPPWNVFRLHVLAIFPKGFSLEQICKVLPPMEDESKRDGKECIDNTDLPKFIAGVKKHGGIVIAAHVDSDRGIRRAFRQLGREGITLYDPKGQVTDEDEKEISEAFKEWILTAGFDAIEVATEADKHHYRWISKVATKEVSIPVLLSNDAHCIDDMTLANKITHIKMASVGFDGLKQALQFPDTRVRFPSDVPTTPSPRILGLEIIAGDEKGFFKELKIAFSDNLTCLIGPRGSGKSTIIEALRYVIGYNRALKDIEFPASELATKVKSLQEATLSKCVIRLVYCRDTNIEILEAAYDPKQDYATKVYTLDGEHKEIADVEASGIYPLRLFGWGELETLGREASRQRDLIDRMIPQLGERLEKRELLRSQLTAKRKEIASSVSKLTSIMSKNSGEIKRYQEYKSDFDKLNTPEVKGLFAALDNAQAKVAVLTKVQHNTKEWVSTIEQFSAPDLTQGVEQLIKNSPEIRDWWEQKREEIRLAGRQSEVKIEMDKGLVIIKHLLNELNGYLKELNEEIQLKDKAIRDKISIEAAEQVRAELRRTASQRLERVSGLQRDYTDEWKRLNSHLEQWAKITKELSNFHDDIRGKRTMRKAEIEASLNKYSTPEMKISLQFFPGFDRTDFKTCLRDSGILSRDSHGNYKSTFWPEKIAAICTPIEFAEAILARDPQRLVKSITLAEDKEFGVDEPMANKLVETLYPFGEDTDANVPIVDEQKLIRILSVAEVKWDDLERIMLNDRPVENVSPGQRASAMLPLIALVEKTPLVIDQPEDNLDNRLVGKMLVDILAALKEQRQIIVATHNPNIVVSGDAEQVIVLEALSNSKGKCAQSGSIDEKEIIHSVIDIMEGGKEAFEVRHKRYEYSL